MNNMPALAKAWVVSQDPDNEAVFVSLSGPHGGSGPTLSVKVGGHGPRDGVVGYFPALPTASTHGLVAFPSGDSRNGVWVCSVSTQLTDASAHAPGNGAADYSAHYGGGWAFRSQNGDFTETFPDGTVIQAGAAPAAPTRHTIDGQQARQRTPFTAAQRRPQTPGAFPLSITSPNGASAVLTASGAWSMTAASGQSVTLSVAGGATFTLSGNTLSIGSDTTVAIASSAAITLTAPSIVAGNGGTTQGVKLADNSTSLIFKAQ